MAVQIQKHTADIPAHSINPLLTSETPFDLIPVEGKHLFSVSEGVTASTALNVASCMLNSSMAIVTAIVDDPDNSDWDADLLYGARYLQEATQALINAAILGIERAVRNYEQ